MPDLFPTLRLAGLTSPSARLELVIDRPVASGSFDGAVAELVRKFAATGGVGAYAARCSSADHSRLAVTGAPKPVLNGLNFELEAARVDPTAFQILRNMLATLNLAGAGVTSVLVREMRQGIPAPVELPVADEDNEDEVYPGLPEDLSYLWDFEDSGSIKFRRIVVEARGSLTPEQVLLFQERVQSWMVLLQEGGFCLPVGPPDEAVCS